MSYDEYMRLKRQGMIYKRDETGRFRQQRMETLDEPSEEAREIQKQYEEWLGKNPQYR